MRRIAIFGSTGSIGQQALDIIRLHPEDLSVTALTCDKNVNLLETQIVEFSPEAVAVTSEEDALRIQQKYPRLTVYAGEKGLSDLARDLDFDVMFNALVGISGLLPTVAAIEGGAKQIALANKETLVAGGSIITKKAIAAGCPIIPVDSEHSAIFQCLQGNAGNKVSKIILTASGGPFLGKDIESLRGVTVDEALEHPNWSMGSKITIDSATLMNKGFEVIEAKWLFGLSEDKIKVIIHPESIVHSMVEYGDGSTIAQLGVPSMKIPISYALFFPNRPATGIPAPDFEELGSLTFRSPDTRVFKCLGLAFDVLRDREHDSGTVVLNGANEKLVQMFLERKIGFLDIQDTIARVLDKHIPIMIQNLEQILEIDRLSRETAERTALSAR